jgi:acetylornithine deacetylase/succinyl-diaminopimelate desuccinylase-like protein
VRGSGGARPVALLSHLDTVPADPSEWSVDPFAGIVEDGFVWGRGALDAKGVGVVHLLALVALAARAEPLPRDVILLATPDEETGGAEGAGWLARERADLLGGAEFLLTEGGGVQLQPEAPPIWNVAVVEKSPCWIRIRARGRAGHSSAPGRDQAVHRLVAALDRVRRVETPIRVVPEVARMFALLAPTAAPEDRAAWSDLRGALGEDDNFRRRFLANRGFGSLVRNTIAITVLEGAPRTNVLPSEAVAHVDARLLPGESCADFVTALAEVIDDSGIELETLLAFQSTASPVDTALFHAIERVAAELDPSALVLPRAIGGFTDAHWFRELGIVSYGFVPRWLEPGEAQGVHGVDERVSIENLERGVDALLRILDEL